MDFLPSLNLDSLHANTKFWYVSPSFLIPSRLNQINTLIQKINIALKTPPSMAHHALYTQFSSPYFWHSIAKHEHYTETKAIWSHTQLLIYADNESLIWFVDYAFPLLEEYLTNAQHDCQTLHQHAQVSFWQGYLPGYVTYLNSLAQLTAQLAALNLKLDQLKQQWMAVVKLKIEENNDILKLIAQKINVSCDFESTEYLSHHAWFLLQQNYALPGLLRPDRNLDTHPPLIDPIITNKNWQTLTDRLRHLKKSYRLTPPSQATQTSRSIQAHARFAPPWLNKFKLLLMHQSITYAGLPIIMSLFFGGWLSLGGAAISIAAWLSYPMLSKLPPYIMHGWQKINVFIDRLFDPYSEKFSQDFIIEHTEYIETIERSALWRKNRLAPGCHHLNSFEPSLIVTPYEDFQRTLQQQIIDLSAVRPYVWQLWRQQTANLIDNLLIELSQEQQQLTQNMQLYATDIAKRIAQPVCSPANYVLADITLFVARFAPASIDALNLENRALHFFLSCLINQPDAPMMLKRPLRQQTHFATHCPDVAAINQLITHVSADIKNPDKLKALLGVAGILKQEPMLSLAQLNNHLACLTGPNYPTESLFTAIQDYLYTTYKQHAHKLFFSVEQHKNLTRWLQEKAPDIQQAVTYIQSIIDLPDHQDWGVLPTDLTLVSPTILQDYLTLLDLNSEHAIRQQLQDKLLKLAPNYNGAPSMISQWVTILWENEPPMILEEMILQARFTWTLDQIITHDHLDPLEAFIQDSTQVLPKADNNHRLSRAFVNQPCFYLPWHAKTQEAITQLEENGLLLANAKAAYSQKALTQWLNKG